MDSTGKDDIKIIDAFIKAFPLSPLLKVKQNQSIDLNFPNEILIMSGNLCSWKQDVF